MRLLKTSAALLAVCVCRAGNEKSVAAGLLGSFHAERPVYTRGSNFDSADASAGLAEQFKSRGRAARSGRFGKLTWARARVCVIDASAGACYRGALANLLFIVSLVDT